MSTTIDQKVVEMRFDNQHFEKNVNTTMSSLDKLKQKLNFSGASKGLDELNNSAKNNNMGVLANSVEVVRNKFSALEVMGITALANITNSAVNAGKRIVKSLTVDPVTTGFNEYELKMGSIQTIMASTGESLEVVNSYLNELNKYSDQTIYSFSDMTQNIGKFTNAGVKLEDAVMAIKGISNEAAVSGANANEASRAMYNFAQALSAGYVKLIDWKSIENANMATVEFKEQLIEAAVAAGTLEKSSDGMYKVLTTNVQGSTMDDVISSTKMFNESLNYQWMTTEVLVNTLRNYADETTEIGKKATQAATEVKTFSQMMDTLKESAQSGWATTWEIVFGDFYEGKKLWTGISKVVGGLIDKMSDLRNNMLRGALTSPWEKLNKKIQDAGLSTKEFNEILEEDLGETAVKELTEQYGSLADALKKGKVPIDNIRKSIKKLLGVEEDVVDKTKKVTGATEAVNKSLKDLDKIAQRVIKGEFGNGAKRMEALAEAGYDYATVQNRVNELLGDSTRHVSKNADAMTELSDAQKKASEGIAGHADSLASLTDEQLKSKGYTEEQIEVLRELQETAEGTGSSIDELIDSMTTTKSGRDLLFEAFGNIGEELTKIFEAIGTAWKNVFGDQEDLTEGFSLYNLISEFHKLTDSMEISENSLGNFQSIVEGVFNGLDLTWSLASASTFGVIKIVNELLKLVGTDIPSVLAFFADGLTKLNKWVEENTIFGSETKWADIAAIISTIATKVEDCFTAFKNLVKIQPIIQRFKDAFAQVKTSVEELFGGISLGKDFLSLTNITTAIENFFKKIEDFIKNIDNLGEGESIGMHIVTGIANGIQSAGTKVIDAIISIGTAIVTAFCDFFQIKSPSRRMMEFGKNIVQGLVNGIKNGAKGLGSIIIKIGQTIVDAIKDFFQIKSPSRLMMTIGGFIIAGLIAGLVSQNTEIDTAIQNLTDFCINGFKKLGSAIADIIQKIDFGKLLAVGLSAGLIWAIKSMADAIALFTRPLAAFEKAGKSIAGFFDGTKEALVKAIKLNSQANALKSLAIAIAVLAGSVWLLAQLDGKKLLGATAAIIVLAGALVGMTLALEKLGGIKDFKFNYLSLLGIAGALLMLALTFNILSKVIDNGNAGEVVIVFIGMVTGFALILKALGKLVGGKDLVNIKGVGKVFTKLAIALLIMVGVIKLISLLRPEEIVQGIATITVLTILFKSILKVFRGTIADALVIRQSGKCIRNITTSLLLMIGVIKVASMLSLSEVVRGGLVVAGIAIFFKALITATKDLSITTADQISAAGWMMLKISAAMMLMAFAIKIIGGMSLSEIGKGLLVLTALSALSAILISVSSDAGAHAAKAGAMIIEISAALLIISLALFLLTSLPSEGIGKAIGVISALATIFAVLITVTHFAGEHADKLKGIFIAFTIAIGVMAIAIAALALLPDQDAVKNATKCLTSVIGMFALLIVAVSKINTETKGFGKILGSIIVLAAVVAGIGYLILQLSKHIKNVDAAVGAAKGIGILLMAMSASLWILGKSKTLEKGTLLKTYGTLAVLAGLAVILSFAIDQFANCEPDRAIGGAIGVGILLLAMSKSLDIMAKSRTLNEKALPGILGTMFILVAVVAVLGEVIKKLDGIDPINAIGNSIALTILLAAVVTAFECISKPDIMVPSNLVKLGLTLGIIVAVIGVLAIVITKLNDINPVNAIGSAVAMGILLEAVMRAFNKMSKSNLASGGNVSGIISTMGMLLGAIFVMGLMIALLSVFNPVNVIASAVALGVLLEALAHSFSVIAKSKEMSPAQVTGITTTLYNMIAALVAMSVIISIMSHFIKDPTTAIASSIALSILLVSLSYSMKVLSTASGITAAAVYPAMLMGVVLLELAIVLGIMQHMKIEPSIETAGALSLLVIALSVACLILSKVGPMASFAVQGAIGLIGVIAVLGTAALFLGEVMSVIDPATIEKWQNGLKSFMDFIVILAEGLGAVIGGFISGVMTGLSVGLPIIGDALGDFYDGAKSFIDGCSKIGADGNLLKGVTMLSLALIEFGAASLISAITSLGGLSLDLIGWQLSNFWKLSQGFFDGMSQLNPKVLTGVKALADAIYTLTKADLLDTLNIFSSNDMELANLGTHFGSLGNGIKTFATKLKGVDTSTIQPACEIIREISKLSSELPNSGGIFNWLVGKDGFSEFAGYLPALGTNLAGFIDNVKGFTDSEVASAKAAGEIIAGLANAASKIPNEGGALGWLLGENGIAGFINEGFPTLGGYIADFVNKLGEMPKNASDSAKTAGEVIVELAKAANKIPNEGGKIGEWFGDNSLGAFAEHLSTLGTKLKDFINNLGTLPEDGATTVSKAIEIITTITELGNTNLNALTTDLGNFSGLLGGFADCMVEFVNGMSEVSTCDVGMSITKLEAIINFAKTASGLNLDSLSSLSTGLKNVAENGVKAFIDAFSVGDALTKVKNAAKKMMDEFIAGVKEKLEPVKTSFEDMVSESLDAIDTQANYNDFKAVGKYLVEGFAKGIDEKTWYAEARAIAMANAAEKAAKDALDINSPSKVFMRLGSGVVEGFAKGIDDNVRDSTKSSEAMANESIKGFSSAISRINDYFSGNIDAQPTIRPVLDLSDVKSGAASISGMFNTPTVGVASNVSAINTMMNQRNQNGPNADVISALDKLRGDLGNIGGTSYNINGITYDDGSNIANAIKVIARAAIQEGRV